jgi:hypothetical protein
MRFVTLLSETAIVASLAMLAASGSASATCAPSSQTINSPVTGPILSNGGAINVKKAGGIAGSGDGIDAPDCGISTLDNEGVIHGGPGTILSRRGQGFAGVSNSETITNLTNGGTITGGAGSGHRTDVEGGAGVLDQGLIDTLRNSGAITGGVAGITTSNPLDKLRFGGVGVWVDDGEIRTLINQSGGTIVGGAASAPGQLGGIGVFSGSRAVIDVLRNAEDATIAGGAESSVSSGGDAGVAAQGVIGRLDNSGNINGAAGGGTGIRVFAGGSIRTIDNAPTGKITGGDSVDSSGGQGVLNGGAIGTLRNQGFGRITGGARGEGVLNRSTGTIEMLTNDGAIAGGAGGSVTTVEGGSNGGAGGAGVMNAGTIVTLRNGQFGTITGGAGGKGVHAGLGVGPSGAGGDGISNTGTIETLRNIGMIAGGVAGSSFGEPAPGAGVSTSGRIGSLINSFTISGGDGGDSIKGGAGVSLGTGGRIDSLANMGSIAGGAAGGDGILVGSGASIGSIGNSMRGVITGGVGGFSGGFPETGGAGLANFGAITRVTDSGAIGGGFAAAAGAGAGGAGLANAATIGALVVDTGGLIVGGRGGLKAINGGAGGVGVANAGVITDLTNRGTLRGGDGGMRRSGGAGLSNTGGIGTLINHGEIAGGAGDASVGLSNSGTISTLTNDRDGAIKGGGIAGEGVVNAGSITSLTNHGSITGADGGPTFGGLGGNALTDTGNIETLRNSGSIVGGAGGQLEGRGSDSRGGIGVEVETGGTIGFLDNMKGGTIVGGAGVRSVGLARGTGGAGVSNTGSLPFLFNEGLIEGGVGVGPVGVGGRGGVGVRNTGAITVLRNTGVIEGGESGAAAGGNRAAAIDSTGGSIGTLINTGQIIGDVRISDSTIVQGSLETAPKAPGGLLVNAMVADPALASGAPGSFTGGAITISDGDLTFASGTTFLGDSISVKGGAGTVTNKGVLELSAGETITGNFDQTKSGELDFIVSGDGAGDYGALDVTGLATLGGLFAIDLEDGLSLSAGESFDLMTFAGVKSDFSSLSFDGSRCSEGATDVWSCSNLSGLSLAEVFSRNGLELEVVTGGFPSPVPEPSTWAMLLIGLGSLGYAGRWVSRKTSVKAT